jgi:aspartate aminotransferase
VGLTCEMPQGAFYAFPQVTRIHKNSRIAAKTLLTKAHVATIPGAVFGGPGEGHVRFSYAMGPAAIQAGLTALKKYLLP